MTTMQEAYMAGDLARAMAEIERLRALNAELLKALIALLDNDNRNQARAAIAKAEEIK